MAGVAKDLAALNFRGEYWRVTPAFSTLASRNIYSVPRHREMPFLDPHWVVRWDGSVSIGPTAIPVLGPYTYDGFAPSFSGLQEALQGSLHPNVLKLMGNSAFWRLAGAEWKSALSREEMAKRVARFIPAMKPGCLAGRGLAGVRSSIIDKSGEFVKEALEIAAPHSFHILNYNSPGATGAPAYAARIVKIVLSGEAGGFLVPQPSSKSGVWDYQGIASRV
jgi:L-2-hydroxyglutarate oxidase